MSTETALSPRAGTAPPTAPGALGVDVVLTWDRWSGWAHLAHHAPGGTSRPVFVGIAALRGASAAGVRAVLVERGFTMLSEYDVDDQLVEFRITTNRAHGAGL